MPAPPQKHSDWILTTKLNLDWARWRETLFPLDTAPPRMRCGNMAAMTVVCTIVLSIVAHGLSAYPLEAALAVDNAVLMTMGKAVVLISHIADRSTLSPALSLL